MLRAGHHRQRTVGPAFLQHVDANLCQRMRRLVITLTGEQKPRFLATGSKHSQARQHRQQHRGIGRSECRAGIGNDDRHPTVGSGNECIEPIHRHRSQRQSRYAVPCRRDARRQSKGSFPPRRIAMVRGSSCPILEMLQARPSRHSGAMCDERCTDAKPLQRLDPRGRIVVTDRRGDGGASARKPGAQRRIQNRPAGHRIVD